MISNIENLFRTIASSDETIARDDIDTALNILLNRQAEEEPLIAVLKPKEVAALLGVTQRAVHKYAAQGHLIKVCGAGKLPLGILRASYIRFTEVKRNI